MSAARSASMIVGAFRLAFGSLGKTEESTTLKPVEAVNPQFAVDRGHVVLAHPAGAAGVVGALHRLPHEGVDLVVALHVSARRDFLAAVTGPSPAGR